MLNYHTNKKMTKKEKNRKDLGKIATRIIAGILALMMIFTVIASLVFYLM